MRVLLTGGSGFIAAHVLEELLKRGHSVVTTVRSQDKWERIKRAHSLPASKLDVAFVEDIAVEGAFDKAVVSNPPFDAVVHTASPFHFNVTDPKKDLLDPAIVGTTGVLKAIKAHAPTVKRVVITSSFAAIMQPDKGGSMRYSEASWNPVTFEQAASGNPATAYRGSKKLAEKAAWEFVEREKPGFRLSTVNPPLVFGPVVHYLNSLDAINTSNKRVRDLVRGAEKEKLLHTHLPLWVDVRDVALAHVLAMEALWDGSDDDGAKTGQRYFATAGGFDGRRLVEIVRDNFPEYRDKLPASEEALRPGDTHPYEYDNSRFKKLLGREFVTLEKSIVDLVKSMQEVEKAG